MSENKRLWKPQLHWRYFLWVLSSSSFCVQHKADFSSEIHNSLTCKAAEWAIRNAFSSGICVFIFGSFSATCQFCWNHTFHHKFRIYTWTGYVQTLTDRPAGGVAIRQLSFVSVADFLLALVDVIKCWSSCQRTLLAVVLYLKCSLWFHITKVYP